MHTFDFKECYLTTRDGIYYPFRTEMIEYNQLKIGPMVTGYVVGSPFTRSKRGSHIYIQNKRSKDIKIKDVIFNDPATIVLWEDGTKTIVKCQDGDTFDKEKGLALCIAKKYFDNKGNFNDVFKMFIKDNDVKANI